ncbi:MAG: hypothetical protein QOF15_365 [Mycobacterium sp.]|jgi:hypothetical protein|nr:hypothetical protein [Mycobacterium sp.]
MNANQPLKKMIVGALLSGGVALAGLGLTAGTAGAAPSSPGPTVDYSDFGVPVVECIQCQRALPGDGSVRVNGPQLGDGSVRVAIPSAGH